MAGTRKKKAVRQRRAPTGASCFAPPERGATQDAEPGRCPACGVRLSVPAVRPEQVLFVRCGRCRTRLRTLWRGRAVVFESCDDEPVEQDAPAGRDAPAALDPRACRKCGCADSHVTHTRLRGEGRVVRYRECRHCGHRFVTEERAIGD